MYDKFMQKLNLSSIKESTNNETMNNGEPATVVHSMLDETNTISQNQNSLIKEKQMNSNMKKNKTTFLIAAIIAILAGTGTGYGAFKLKAKSSVSGKDGSGPTPIQQVATEKIKVGDVFGVQDVETFKDSAEGYLQKGGIDDEGSHQLLRPGGISQTVFLVSSITDLDKFEGMQVKIWGETFKAQKAGWLMDVGRVEIVDPEAKPPVED